LLIRAPHCTRADSENLIPITFGKFQDSTPSAEPRTLNTGDLRLFVDQVFTDVPAGWGLSHQDIMERIQRIDELKPSGARKRLAALVSGGFVRHSEKKYHRGHQCS